MTSCHPILSVIIQVIDKLDSRFAVVITYMITNPKQQTPPGPVTIINYHNIFSPLKHLSHLWKVLCLGAPPPSPSLPHSLLATACFCIKICPSKNNKPSKLEIVATKVVG